MKRIVSARPHLKVRSGPGAEYRQVGQLADGASVEVIEPNPNGGPWVYVGQGWVHGDYLVTAAAPPAVGRPGWRLARALEQLRAQVDLQAPKRSKRYDGTIGDAAHRGRKSDHNPDPATGVVRARDFTHDPQGGVDCEALVDRIVESRDERVSYLIWNGWIWRSYPKGELAAWEPGPYRGANPHDKHVHVSVVADPALYDDVRPWVL